ncbi:MAG: hypothetical protein M1821_006660 [Bathelium mastoideum]|nr:MAG: hypothetical protein M1821_006660 [Bathelium mastoideum]
MTNQGSSARYSDRAIPKISLHNFDARVDEITAQLVHAAETDGFFSIIDTGISLDEIEAMFAQSEAFFNLSDSVKGNVPWSPRNVGWEKNGQVRPSTGTPDMKESYQLQFGSNMEGMWIDDPSLPEFKSITKQFMHHLQQVSEKLMLCFARGLGMPDEVFIKAHDASKADCQTVLRLLHYPAVEQNSLVPKGYFRAGAHADWDLLTLLFQRPGQGGLEICPGREVVTEFGIGDTWTKIEFEPGDIVCNIGDLLMSWSDDRFKSTFHRVVPPVDKEHDYWGDRYSMAFFNQPCSSATIQGPLKKYPVVTGEEFNRNAMNRNFAALKAKKEAMETSKHGLLTTVFV